MFIFTSSTYFVQQLRPVETRSQEACVDAQYHDYNGREKNPCLAFYLTRSTYATYSVWLSWCSPPAKIKISPLLYNFVAKHGL